MLATTKQFRKAIRTILKKHNVKIHSANTFGTSGSYRCFSTFGKRKISFNILVDNKEQWKAIVRDCKALWKGTWQSNLMKYTWDKCWNDIELKAEDCILRSNCRIEGTCIYNDMTQDKWDKHIQHKLKEIMWTKHLVNNNTL